MIVGTIHTPGGFRDRAARRVDFVEVRMDVLRRPPDPEALLALPAPVLLTVRRGDEGGGWKRTEAEREALYLKYLPVAAAVDIELRSARSLRRVSEAAGSANKLVILSSHHFDSTPSLRELTRIVRAAGHADIVKIATRTERPADVARLLELLEATERPLAVMGMGTLGRASRLLFAKAGSILNYGWLHRPQVPGQWNAGELADLLKKA